MKINLSSTPQKIIALMLAIFLFPTFVLAQDLNSIDQQIQQKQDQLNATQQQGQTLQGQLNSFDQSIGQVQNQLADTQNQINEKETQIVNLTAQIDQKQKELDKEKQTLNDSLVFLYETGDTPVIEIFLSSKSVSSALDQMEYISWVEKQIQDTVNKIAADKKAIEASKKQVEDEKTALSQLEEQQSAKLAALSEQKNAKSELLAYTQNNEQIYQQKLGSLQEQRAYLLTLYNVQISTGGTGGYPYDGYQMDANTDFGPARECTSYSAWKRASVGRPLTFSWGNAGEWAGQAMAAGYSVDGNPKAGDVMVIPTSIVGGVGHVAYVESVNGNKVYISQYNYGFDGRFSEMTAPVSWVVGSSYIH